MKKGQRVTILQSNHPDVRVGETGTIDCQYRGGFGVKIEGPFYRSGVIGKSSTDTRVIWFPKHALK